MHLRRPARTLLVLALAGVCLGCSGDAESTSQAALIDVPEPVLDAVEPGVRRQIESAEANLRSALEDPSTETGDLAQAFGELGRVYHAYQFLEAADVAYTNARQFAPSVFHWAYLQALVREEDGRKEKAIEALNAALQLDPNDLPARVRRASLHKDLGRLELARGELESVLAARDDVALAHYYLAQIAADRSGWAEAARRFERVLELQPGASRVHYPLSRVYQRLGRTAEAMRQAEQTGTDDVTLRDPLLGPVLSLKQGTASLVRRGAAAQIVGDWRAAEAAYREAVAANPESVEVRMSLGGALIQNGDLAGAEVQLRRAVELDPDQALAWYNLAGVLRNQQRFDAALAAYHHALKLSPTERKFLLARARTEIDAGRPKAARTTYESLLAAEPDSVDAEFGLAELDATQARSADAVRRLEALLDRDLMESQRRVAWLGLADLQARSSNAAAALAHYQRAAASAEGDPTARVHLVDAHFGRANLLGAMGRFGEAAQAYETVASLAPGRAEAWLGGATARVLTEDWSAARSLLERGLLATDDRVDLQHALARLLATAPEPETRDGELALRLAQAALDQGGPTDYAETVGMALAELGRWKEAIDWQQRVIDQLESAGQVERAAAARALRDQYHRRQPVRQGASS